MNSFTMRVSVALIILLITVSATCACLVNRRVKVSESPTATSQDKQSQKQSNANEDYAVYSAVLADERYADKLFVIREHTFHGGFDATDLNKEIPELTSETIKDYQVKNGSDQTLRNAFDVGGKCVFLSDKEQETLFAKGHDGWETFYKKYPDARGIISFSNVGFNSERTQALLNVGIGCGWLCGEGNFIVLRKTNGKWSVQQKHMTWVS